MLFINTFAFILHILKENTLRLFKHHVTGFALIDLGDHGSCDLACLTAGNRAVAGVRKIEIGFHRSNVAGNTGDNRVVQKIQFDVFGGKQAQRDITYLIVVAAAEQQGANRYQGD